MTLAAWTWSGFALAAVVAIAAGVLWRQLGDRCPAGRRLPATAGRCSRWRCPTRSGKQEPLGQWKGKVLIVNFWATWCEPCKEEMPRFMKLQNDYGNKGLQFVGIAIDQPDKVRSYRQGTSA